MVEEKFIHLKPDNFKRTVPIMQHLNQEITTSVDVSCDDSNLGLVRMAWLPFYYPNENKPNRMTSIQILSEYLEENVIDPNFIFENLATKAYFEIIEMRSPSLYLAFEGVPSLATEYYMMSRWNAPGPLMRRSLSSTHIKLKFIQYMAMELILECYIVKFQE
uniref:Uncharacterized protein n=1 Tax=Meloidogyne incognita TaxID=6306 RepID=A0A914KQZ6_MELIC